MAAPAPAPTPAATAAEGVTGDVFSTTGSKVALIAGATGLVGRQLLRELLTTPSEWKLIYGVARHAPVSELEEEHAKRYHLICCDLLDHGVTTAKLGPLANHVTHVFWLTWASQFQIDTPECCEQNRAMLSNALDALLPLPAGSGASALRHLTLQTGTRHYVSLTSMTPGDDSRCYDEESPRVVGADVHNFYYVLEDLVAERLQGRPMISWSVHRPGMLLGASWRSYFNVMGSLCVYGSICRHLGLPFLFMGSRHCWEEHYLDISDARLVAHQQIWWASSSLANGCRAESFNAVNGTTFAWKDVWSVLAAKLGLPVAETGGTSSITVDSEWMSEEMSYSQVMGDKEEVWQAIVEKNGLRCARMQDLANWGFLDAVFRFPGKLLSSSDKACCLGFTTRYSAEESLLYWVDRMREDRLIPC